MAYELKLTNYSGPLEKLLELIEARELEINQINLAAVTDDFLKYVDMLTGRGEEATGEEAATFMRIIADFLVVASRLIFIKSRSLLPGLTLSSDDEADIKDFEHRLRFYQAMKPAMKTIANLWKEGKGVGGRTYLMGVSERVFYPAPSMTEERLHDALAGLLQTLERYVIQNQTVRDTVISLEAKIKEVMSFMIDLKETSFSNLSSTKPRGEIIIAFLAILHLAREQLISIEQKDNFSDIIIRTSPSPQVEPA
jgi:segregation and condensation protein A